MQKSLILLLFCAHFVAAQTVTAVQESIRGHCEVSQENIDGRLAVTDPQLTAGAADPERYDETLAAAAKRFQ